jgi:hypothetical protein
MAFLGFGLLTLSVGFRELASNHSRDPYPEMALMCKLAGWVVIVCRELVYVHQTLGLR